MNKRNILLTIEYDGTNYHGWQIQPNALTIQEILEKALHKLTNENIKLIGASRTDKGVHALDQRANFITTVPHPLKAFHQGLNSLIPEDIRIKNAEEVDITFDSRKNAKSKIYSYYIYQEKTNAAIFKNYMWHIEHSLDIEKMQEALNILIGKHDFSSFRAADCDSKNSIRQIYSTEIKIINNLFLRQDESALRIKIEGSSFLKFMVRNITGTIVNVGTGKTTISQFKEIFCGKDRTKAGATAPASGLVLERIKY